MKSDVKLLSDGFARLQDEVKELREDCAFIQQENKDLKAKDERLEKTITEMVRKVDDLEGRSKPHNLFHGVVRAEKESVVLFSTKLSFTASCYDLTSKAKKALLCIMQKLRILNINSFELFLKLFDSQVQPIALYVAEL